MFIIPLEECPAGLSDVSFHAIGTRESVNTTSAEFRDLLLLTPKLSLRFTSFVCCFDISDFELCILFLSHRKLK